MFGPRCLFTLAIIFGSADSLGAQEANSSRDERITPETLGFPKGSARTSEPFVTRIYKTDEAGQILKKQPAGYPFTISSAGRARRDRGHLLGRRPWVPGSLHLRRAGRRGRRRPGQARAQGGPGHWRRDRRGRRRVFRPGVGRDASDRNIAMGAQRGLYAGA
jgi:hypothetical protein